MLDDPQYEKPNDQNTRADVHAGSERIGGVGAGQNAVNQRRCEGAKCREVDRTPRLLILDRELLLCGKRLVMRSSLVNTLSGHILEIRPTTVHQAHAKWSIGHGSIASAAGVGSPNLRNGTPDGNFTG